MDDVWGIDARNKEQSFALELLMDPDVEVVSLIGQAGSGKTLLAVAAGLEQVLGDDNEYKKLIVSRPIQPLGKDIGFLPGTLEEKMDPWLMPIKDNLEFLLGNDRDTVKMYFEKGVIEIEAITYIRGRSITNAFIIIDEAQNLTRHELKTILTRVGEGTKIILTGDIEQIDNIYIDETSNGLTYAVEKFKEYDISGHITLQKGERSKVATLAAKIL
jgi:PhoH-like ATPase